MFAFFKRWFQQHCFFCKSKKGYFTKYQTVKGETFKVCTKCLEYAERRAFKKVN